MFKNIPKSFETTLDWGWAEFESYAQDLNAREITAENLSEWLPASSRSFVFINGRGGNGDLFVLFHEFGHAVQLIEMSSLPYMRQKMLPDEISEVASTTMERLASDHLFTFYAAEKTEVVRRNHFIEMLYRWPYVAMVSLVQHWAYTNPEQGVDPAACDAYWLSLWHRFMPGVDYTGFEEDIKLQWREFFQVFAFPFYSIKYAFAQLGTVQIWEKYQRDPKSTIGQFRRALSLGHTVPIPEFYELAGAKFFVDAELLSKTTGAIQNAL